MQLSLQAKRRIALFVVGLFVVMAALVGWAVLSVTRAASQANVKVIRPFDKYTRLSYESSRLDLYLDPHGRLFGVERWALSTGQGDIRRLPSGVGIEFGATPDAVARRFGLPQGEIWLSSQATAYGYWVQKEGRVLLEHGYRVFEFRNGKLVHIIAFFSPIELEGSLRLGAQMSEVLRVFGQPNSTRHGKELQVAEDVAAPSFPLLVPVGALVAAGLLATIGVLTQTGFLWFAKSAPLRVLAGACIGAICCAGGLIGIASASGIDSLAARLPAAIPAAVVGLGVGALFGLLLWPDPRRKPGLVGVLTCLIGGWVWCLAVLVLLVRADWQTRLLFSVGFLIFEMSWVLWQSLSWFILRSQTTS